MALAMILLLVVGLGLLSLRHEQELRGLTNDIFALLGLPGLFAILFISDAVFSPIPPDAVLIVLSRTHYHEHWILLVLVIGLQSVLAGSVGYFLGRWFGDARFGRLVLGRVRVQHAALIERRGVLAVAIAALTPLPFSLTCWAAGMLHMPFRRFLWPCWLRLPRFILYYAAIAYADDLARWSWG
jgi:membrane protein YqaA with SNARE-associated domain